MPADEIKCNLLENVDKALELRLLHRYRMTVKTNGDIEHEITANDGRSDGDHRNELTELRQTVLKKDKNDQLLKEQLEVAFQKIAESEEENAKLSRDNHQLFTDAETNLQNTEDEKKKNELLRERLAASAAKVRDCEKKIQSLTDKNRSQENHQEQLKSTNENLSHKLNQIPKQQQLIDAAKNKLAMTQKSYDDLHACHEQMTNDFEEKLQLTETALTTERSTTETLRKELVAVSEQLTKCEAEVKNDTKPPPSSDSRKTPSSQQKTVKTPIHFCPSSALARKRHFETKVPQVDRYGRKIFGQHQAYLSDTHWNGISVTNGNLNFDSAVDLSKLPAPIIAKIKMELGLKLSDLSDVSDLQAPDGNSDKLVLKELLVRAFKNDHPSAPTKSDSMTEVA